MRGRESGVKLHVRIILVIRIPDSSHGDAQRRCVFYLSQVLQRLPHRGRDILPYQRVAGGEVVPRVWTRFGVFAIQDAFKDTHVEVDEVLQDYL